MQSANHSNSPLSLDSLSQVVASSDKYIVLIATVPTTYMPGNYSCTIGPSTSSNLYASVLNQALFSIAVGRPRPHILLASPSQASTKGGEEVRLFISGFPSPIQRSAVSVYFGSSAMKFRTDLTADGIGNNFLLLVSPAGIDPGLSSVTIEYNVSGAVDKTSSILTASLPFMFISDLIYFTCVSRFV
jgi:hypothetical protein